MPDPRWMSVVIYQRQHGEWIGGEERPPYGDIDAEPLPAKPEQARASIAERLTVRLRSVVRAGERAQGAFR
jgi:hypothetical protein